ncbi:MAG TPA: GNAT family N-acetyltransferase [Solirubrobacteraceae bacterium]
MSADGVIVFRRRGIAIAEAYFEPEGADAPSLGRVDLLRIVGAFAPPSERGSRQLHTLVIDLGADEDTLLEQMSKDTRYKIRRAMQKDPVRAGVAGESSGEAVDAFADFYDRFAAAQSVAPAFRPRLHALAGHGNLVITAATGEDGAALVQHAYVAAHRRSYMLYSASVLAESADGDMRNLVGRANRYLHWHDIRMFKERGFALYDFGGLDVTGRSEKTTNIARFKRGFGGQVRPVYSSTHSRSLRGAAVQRILALRGVDF